MEDDLPIIPKDLPTDCDIVELSYRLKKPESTHVDVTISASGVERSLRFHRPRVVQFAKDLPDILHGLEVDDIRAQGLPGELALWVSIGAGAVTFWARDVVEITRVERTVRHASDLPVKPWEILTGPEETYNYRAPKGGAFRAFSITTRPFGNN